MSTSSRNHGLKESPAFWKSKVSLAMFLYYVLQAFYYMVFTLPRLQIPETGVTGGSELSHGC